jgi:hypothetical protein
LASKVLTSPSPKLSPEGRAIVQDLRGVIFHAKQLVLVKNEGNLFQEFMWEAEQQRDTGLPKESGVPVDRETAKEHGTQALDGLKTLGTLVVTNGQFRKLSTWLIIASSYGYHANPCIVSDATILLRDMAADTAMKAATRIKPSEDELAQVDQPADENVWHEKPDLSKGKAALKSQFSKLRRGVSSNLLYPRVL